MVKDIIDLPISYLNNLIFLNLITYGSYLIITFKFVYNAKIKYTSQLLIKELYSKLRKYTLKNYN